MEVSLVEDDAVVEAFSAKGSPEALDVGVLPRRFGRSLEGFDAHVFNMIVEDVTKDGVSIPQKVFGRGVFGKSVSDLLSGPGRGGGVSGVEV